MVTKAQKHKSTKVPFVFMFLAKRVFSCFCGRQAKRGGFTRTPEQGVKKFYTKGATPCLVSGFTIVELIVVISIFAALTGVVLFRFADFSSNIFLQNMAQKIALQVKRAQTAGSLGQFPNLGPGQQGPPTPWVSSYGIYFETGSTTFVYFFDRNKDGLYDASTSCLSGTSECLSEITLRSGYEIVSLCVDDCTTIADEVDELHISFTRPHLTATIIDEFGNEDYFNAKITVRSPSDRERSIIVHKIGQISVE